MEKKIVYDCDYFINKFNNSIDSLWCTGRLRDGYGRTCSLGWCGGKTQGTDSFTEEAKCLCVILHPLYIRGVSYREGFYNNAPAMINNGDHPNYQQEHPKQRIIAALYDIKKLTQPEPIPEPKVKERIRYISVSVSPSIKELVKEVVTN